MMKLLMLKFKLGRVAGHQLPLQEAGGGGKLDEATQVREKLLMLTRRMFMHVRHQILLQLQFLQLLFQ
jgi:hypothetical protein